ncbi:YfhO family protein [Candidatus Roizmanbacteria bacterium]|nr:YfhO family protein [Candidatus Roizmanbacteria bacterium]
MNKKTLHLLWGTFFICILGLFCYLRLKPILLMAVPYTYDQGRDLLKAAEIVLYHHLTFIGPTTGIMGVFHGVWWFYVAAISFVLFKGNPVGIYLLIFFTYLCSLLTIAYFLHKQEKFLEIFIFSLLIALSPYFIFISIFAANNVMAPPMVLGLMVTTYILLTRASNKKTALLAGLTGLFLGFVAEFEFAFGIFIIPSFIILSLIYPSLRVKMYRLNSLLFFAAGLFTAFIPRILFEFKNGFHQTLILLNFFVKPKLYNPKPFIDIVRDRTDLFIHYYRQIFPNDFTMYLFTTVSFVFLFLIVRHKDKERLKIVSFYAVFTLLLFIFSLFYKDNFWGNYYEGIQYMFLMVTISLFMGVPKEMKRIGTILKGVILFTLIISGGIVLNQAIHSPEPQDGLVIQSRVVGEIEKREKNKEYCVKIYTPPVIPYTYNYLFLYNSIKGNLPEPKTDWVQGKCWFIIESDDVAKRRQDWIEGNIPSNAIARETFTIYRVNLYLYEKPAP